ncbi:MAG: hypothetical protein J5865_06215 [Lachnospiraceae bacterium]|nr:hypothetical protein [Lachnospiraceae bacterium]
MKKATTIILSAAALLLAAGVGVSAFLSYKNFKNYAALSAQLEENAGQVTNVSSQVDGMREEVRTRFSLVQSNMDSMREALEKKDEPEETKENEVTIAGQYVIRATTQISDAYLSGDASALSDKDKETLDMASAILKEIITDKMTPYEKELAVYEWMTHNLDSDPGLLPVVPTTQADCDNPYGVLKYHNAVCVGYATTFRMFMQMMEIPCMVVHNTEMYHSWDLVQLNGHWYHTDIYSDVSTSNHMHFNRTDSMQQMEQSWDFEYFPKSDSDEDCYAAKNAVTQNDVFQIPAEIRKALEGDVNFLAYRIPKEADNRSALVLENFMQRIEQTVEYSSGCEGTDISWQWMPMDNNYVIAISIAKCGSGEDVPTLPDEDLNRIENIMEEIFGDFDNFCDDPSLPKG